MSNFIAIHIYKELNKKSIPNDHTSIQRNMNLKLKLNNLLEAINNLYS